MAAGVSHLCRRSECFGGALLHEETLGYSCKSEDFHSPFCHSLIFFLIFLFHSFPLLTTIVLHSPLCVAAPSSSKLTGGRERECKGGRAVQVRGTHHGSDRVSAPSKAFHHIFVAVCTPALQSEHSKLLLMLCGLLCVLLQRALLLLLAKLFCAFCVSLHTGISFASSCLSFSSRQTLSSYSVCSWIKACISFLLVPVAG